MNSKVIYLLTGPKGSGKSFTGKIMEREFGIRFIRVEDKVKEIKKDRQIDDESYLEEVFVEIEKMVREALTVHDKIAFESTGLTAHFDRMLKNLKKDHNVITISVYANEELCIKRVRSRDKSVHIDVSDEQVKLINRMVIEKNMITDAVIINDNINEEELVEEIREIVKNISL
ncbi:MAG TPA: AAA family ATPase [Ignavibacteria bacterium]|nr:AAA family ATPase [Ignavibacteria bacterium]HMR41340.1 AAA family ATPase [Ignavibacteria bacterium]